MIFLCFCISLNMFIVLPWCVLNCLVAWTLSTCNYWFLPSCPCLASKFNAYGNISGTKCHIMSFSCMIRINCFDFLVETGRVRSLFSQIFRINYLVVLIAGYVSSIIVYLFIVVRCNFLFCQVRYGSVFITYVRSLKCLHMMVVLQVVILQRPNHLNLQFSYQVVVEEEQIWHGIIVEKLMNLVLDVKKLN